ncbi:hypothetical protein GOP47_0008695 [Adiantum capillus-veneris]|uniref:CRAL-TRIO domain-containing protein n=1 Tax=Adiantum capillus-veneris TaxID=13818 RepID=A0A9D4ZKZ1_ADICA|nr:hypothetical protein GOP47_0008695 [Adiantum capillus-veneris]
MDVPSQKPPSDGDDVEAKLAAMRSSLLAQGLSIQGIDDAMLLRFLRARAMHVPRATKMLAEHQRWRASFAPRGFISESEVESELAQRKAFLQGISKKTGHPLLIMVARNHVCNRSDIQEFKRFVVYSSDKIIASAPVGVEKHVVIVDLEGIGYKNMDVKSFLSSAQIFQNYYPERMARIYFVGAPSIFASFWKMASRLIDKVTREKIVFVDGNKPCDSLIDEFDADVLPKAYGGKADLILIQDAQVPNWPPKDSLS